MSTVPLSRPNESENAFDLDLLQILAFEEFEPNVVDQDRRKTFTNLTGVMRAQRLINSPEVLGASAITSLSIQKRVYPESLPTSGSITLSGPLKLRSGREDEGDYNLAIKGLRGLAYKDGSIEYIDSIGLGGEEGLTADCRIHVPGVYDVHYTHKIPNDLAQNLKSCYEAQEADRQIKEKGKDKGSKFYSH